jgi:tetratricopeptide (TPR) repeat protein
MRPTRVKTHVREPRRWRTPPPLIRGSETLEGMDILREVGSEAGVLLWQSYRNVMFWATAEPGERARLFSAEASRKRLAEVAAARLPHGAGGAAQRHRRAARGARGVPPATRWRGVHRHQRVGGSGAARGHALAFTQAAALAMPRSAALALKVGQVARDRAEMARAETWFRHAIMISRQVGDWETYARAYIALGNMAIKRGSFPVAHRMHIKALRAARRKGLPALQGMAAHDLFVVALETGRHAQAEEYARAAFRAYGPHHDRLPVLAQDVAYLWMQQGHFAPALEVFDALRPHAAGKRDFGLTVVSNIARAAGGVGEREVFRKAWVEVNRLAKEPEVRPVLAAAMLELARGAASLGEWDRAEQAASRQRVATELRQSKVMISADAVLDSVRTGRRIERGWRTPHLDGGDAGHGSIRGQPGAYAGDGHVRTTKRERVAGFRPRRPLSFSTRTPSAARAEHPPLGRVGHAGVVTLPLGSVVTTSVPGRARRRLSAVTVSPPSLSSWRR